MSCDMGTDGIYVYIHLPINVLVTALSDICTTSISRFGPVMYYVD